MGAYTEDLLSRIKEAHTLEDQLRVTQQFLAEIEAQLQHTTAVISIAENHTPIARPLNPSLSDQSLANGEQAEGDSTDSSTNYGTIINDDEDRESIELTNPRFSIRTVQSPVDIQNELEEAKQTLLEIEQQITGFLSKYDLFVANKDYNNSKFDEAYHQIGAELEAEFKTAIENHIAKTPQAKLISFFEVDVQAKDNGGFSIPNGHLLTVKAVAKYKALERILDADPTLAARIRIGTSRDVHTFMQDPNARDAVIITEQLGGEIYDAQAHELKPFNPKIGQFGLHCIRGYDTGLSAQFAAQLNVLKAKHPEIQIKHFGKDILDAIKAGFELVEDDIDQAQYRSQDISIYKEGGQKLIDYITNQQFGITIVGGDGQEVSDCVGTFADGAIKAGVKLELWDSSLACLSTELSRKKRLDQSKWNRNSSIIYYLHLDVTYLWFSNPALQTIPERPIQMNMKYAADASNFFYRGKSPLRIHYRDIFIKEIKGKQLLEIGREKNSGPISNFLVKLLNIKDNLISDNPDSFEVRMANAVLAINKAFDDAYAHIDDEEGLHEFLREQQKEMIKKVTRAANPILPSAAKDSDDKPQGEPPSLQISQKGAFFRPGKPPVKVYKPADPNDEEVRAIADSKV